MKSENSNVQYSTHTEFDKGQLAYEEWEGNDPSPLEIYLGGWTKDSDNNDVMQFQVHTLPGWFIYDVQGVGNYAASVIVSEVNNGKEPYFEINTNSPDTRETDWRIVFDVKSDSGHEVDPTGKWTFSKSRPSVDP